MNWINTLSQWLVRHRNILLIINLMIAAIIGTQIPKVQIGTVKQEIGYEKNHYVIQNKLLEETFPEQDRKLFLIVGSKQGELLNNDNIDLIRLITEKAEALTHVESARSLSNSNLLKVYDNELELEALIPDQSEFTQEEINAITARLKDDDDLNKLLISEDLSLSPIIVSYRLPEDISFQERLELETTLVTQSNELLTLAGKNNDQVKLFTLGWGVNFTTQIQEMQNILFELTPVVLFISCSAFWLLIRSVRALILGLASLIILSEVFVLGMVGGLGIPLDQLSAMAPAIVIMVMGADSVHVMSSFFQNLRAGQEEESAMINALEFNLLPILLTTVTTTFGFLSLNFSEVGMVQDLGNITAFGTVIAFFITLTVMPALLLMRENNTPVEPLTLAVVMNKLAKLIIKFQKPIFYSMSAFIIFSLAGLSLLEVNYFPGKQFNKGHPVRDNIDFLDNRIPVRYPAMYVFDSGQEEGIYNPEFLKNVDAFAEWNRQQDEILNANSYVDLLKKTHRKMNGDLPEFETIPDSEDQIAQYMLLLDLMDFGDYDALGMSEDLSKLRLTVQTVALSTKESYDIENRSLEWLQQNAPELELYALGGSYTWPHIFSKALYDLIEGAIYAVIAISVILVFAFRSIAYGVLSIIPNLFPALVVFGIWSYLVGHITFIEACIFSITIGIVVDDTVHFVSKYLTHRKMGYNFDDAIIKTFESVGTALVITTVTFTLGLFVLLFSYLHEITLIVKLMVPILYMALILDFFYLPTVLLRFENFIKKFSKKEKVST